MSEGTFDGKSKKSANVTAAELVRGFAKWRDAAQVAPVRISTHGRVTHILLSAQQFQQMNLAGSDQTAARRHMLDGLADYLHEGVMVVDPDDRIVFANNFAKALCQIPDLEPGAPYLQALPSAAGSPFETLLRRTAASFEPQVADLPLAERPGRWVNFQSLPLNGNVVLVFRDITEEVASERLADVRQAALKALDIHPSIAYIRISPTATIERVNKAFSERIGLSPERLQGVKVVDIVERKSRVTMSEAVDAVLGNGGEQIFNVCFNPNLEGSFDARCSAVALRGAYGREGAVIICSDLCD